jgi:hypothetical protein
LKNPWGKGKKIELNGHFGIIHFLRQIDPNIIVLSFSSNCYPNDYTDNPEAIFKYENEAHFLTYNNPKSWFCFQFKNKKIILSGYFFRNGPGTNYCHSPQGWRLDGSNDGSSWIEIHSTTNQACFKNSPNEARFACQNSQPFSFFKFTQTQKNNCNQDYFRLGFADFFEIILDE